MSVDQDARPTPGAVDPPGVEINLADPLLTVTEVAQYLRVKPSTVRILAKQGKLHASKLGRAWRFRRSDLEAFLLVRRS